MSEQDQRSIWERSSFVRFFRWLFSWRGIRFVLIVLAWVATTVALLYGIENWRGRRAWNKYANELRARGEQLDLKAFIPSPVADPENFAATPLVRSWFPKAASQWDDNYEKVSGKISRKVPQNKRDRRLTDLVAWQMAFEALRSGKLAKAANFESDKFDRESRARAAAVVLDSLKDVELRLLELRTASARPYSQYPVHYDLDNPWGVLLPHLPRLKGVCQRLHLRASAKLAAGDSAGALEDVKLLLYVADSLKEEPFLISYLVRIACFQIGIQAVWEGLAEHRWSETQVQELQNRLASYNFFMGLERSLDAERAAGILTADLLYQRKYRLSHLTGEPGDQSSMAAVADSLARIAPRGWYYLEQLNLFKLFELQIEGAFDVEGKRVFPAKVEQQGRKLERELTPALPVNREIGAIFRHRTLAALLLPALGRTSLRAAAVQASADQALIACALERYRLAQGQFPENLQALVPKFLEQVPTDVLTGDPYKYRRTEDGQFVLYSPGWDEKDDGGTPGKNLHDEKAGDWVWQYPPQQSTPNAALN